MDACTLCGCEVPVIEEGEPLCTACAADVIEPIEWAEWDRLYAERAAEAPVIYLAA